ncbi:MAG: phosphoribosylformylglycinamidine cyclo-ligase [Candidatus Hydrogenedentota bacterium]|nr:MAG: phosphoribosylformylglycinamidine cyclo-ligase [Candidatus Hydrogenedentota bacterium]
MSDKKKGLSYRDAGVNIDAADEGLARIKESVKRTFDQNVLQDIGSFGAMYRFDHTAMEEPILVSSVDGVGTKLKVAFMTGKHETVGVDLVSHCVNDILVQGARPMFFLDYLAFGTLDPEVVEKVITGIATGCRYAGCSLIGGETAEMPGMYTHGEYDLAGTIVGVVDKPKIIDGSQIQSGDVIIGLKSSGLHTNGYSLARKICFERDGLSVTDPMPGTGQTVGDALMAPHREYARVMQIVMRIVNVKGMVHVTGGGITDNIPRILPDGLKAEIDLTAWEVPPIFKYLQEAGGVEEKEMLRTFNCGMGFMVMVSADEKDRALDAFAQALEDPKVIGRIVEGDTNEVAYSGGFKYAPTVS